MLHTSPSDTTLSIRALQQARTTLSPMLHKWGNWGSGRSHNLPRSWKLVSWLSVGVRGFHYAIAASGRHKAELPSQHEGQARSSPGGGERSPHREKKQQDSPPNFHFGPEDPAYIPQVAHSVPNLLLWPSISKTWGLDDKKLWCPFQPHQPNSTHYQTWLSLHWKILKCMGPLLLEGMWDGGEGRQSNGKQIFSRDGSKHRCWHGRAGGVAELESWNR